jgi:hypothetical protein
VTNTSRNTQTEKKSLKPEYLKARAPPIASMFRMRTRMISPKPGSRLPGSRLEAQRRNTYRKSGKACGGSRQQEFLQAQHRILADLRQE